MNQNHSTKLAVVTGALALIASSGHVAADTGDALLNKLVQKGVLTQQEASELKEDTAQEFHKSFMSNLGAPAWLKSYKLNGDFRGRLDYIGGNSAYADNYRLRYRIRAGLTLDMTDHFQVNFRLGSGDAGGNPLSNNTTMENNATKKPIWVDTAFARWTPVNDDFKFSAMFGKMVQPFDASPMVFDPDYTPEGGAVQLGYKLCDHHTIRFNGAGFMLDQLNSRSPVLVGAQAIWDAAWCPDVTSSLGVAVYDIENEQYLGNGAVPNGNAGNTRTSAGIPMYHFNPVVAGGNIIYKLDSAPLYHGKFPIKVAGEYLNNPAAPSGMNQGYWAGIVFGAAGKKGNWDIAYRYQHLESDAWYEEVVNDDNVGFYTASPAGSGFSGMGMRGGTNVKGHLVTFDYSITDALTLSFNCYINSLINKPAAGSSDAMHAMVDLMWKF